MDNKTIPSIDELIDYYSKNSLLAYPEIIKDFSQRLSNLYSKIPTEEIRRNVALLTVWPLVEAYKISEKSIANDIKKEEKEKRESLYSIFDELKNSEDISDVTSKILNGKDWEVNYLNPNFSTETEFLRPILSTAKFCEPFKRHIDKTTQSKTKLIHDAAMGGSIYLMGKDNQIPYINNVNYSFLMRSFICVKENGHPTIFIDSIEGGEPYFSKLDHWRGFDEEDIKSSQNRIHQIYLALGAVRYMADVLDIGTIIPRDFELTELSRNFGVGEKKVFSKEQEHWKIGLHSEKRNSGVYTHTLYRANEKNYEGTQVKFNVLENFTYKNSSDMLKRLRMLGENIINANSSRTRSIAPRTYQKIDALNSMYELIENYPLTTEQRRNDAREMMKSVYASLNNFEINAPQRIIGKF